MHFNFPDRILYLDLDGSFADFDGMFFKAYGIMPWEVKKMKKWQMVHSYDKFFLNLPPMDGAIEFYDKISHYPHIVLTGCPASEYETVALQKREWARKHLNKDIMVLPTKGSSSKCVFLHNKGDVLFDDRADVCHDWERMGGQSVHFTGNYGTAYHRIVVAMSRSLENV